MPVELNSRVQVGARENSPPVGLGSKHKWARGQFLNTEVFGFMG